MKNNYIKISLIVLIILSVFVIVKPNKIQEVNIIKEEKEYSKFAIYKEETSGGGTYVLSNEPSFPTKGYLLNLEETKCYDYEGKPVTTSGLSQASDGKIIIETNATKYCDLYFTKDDKVPVVSDFAITGKDASGEDLTNGYTYNNEVTYNVEWNDTDVTHYCLTTSATSCDQTWVETGGGQSITVKNSTFTSTDGAHTIYVYLKDKAQNVSSTTDISKKTITVDRTAPSTPTFSIMGKTTGGSNLNGDYSQVVGVGVTLTIGSDIKDYCITTSATCSSTEWKSATTTLNMTLPNTEGNKTYNAYVRDNANNVSGKATDSIFLDLNNPSVSKVTYVSKDTSSITVKVEGTDGSTGSGIVKYECKATTQNTWFTQVGDTCKVTGLNDGTEYTIEGRVTDASGRVSTNSVSTTQSTEAAYSCSAGEELVQDVEKGSSSGGYICKASASSKGWYDTNTYYTCSVTGEDQYTSRSSANSACQKTTKGNCSLVGKTVEYEKCKDGTQPSSSGRCTYKGTYREVQSFACMKCDCSSWTYLAWNADGLDCPNKYDCGGMRIRRLVCSSNYTDKEKSTDYFWYPNCTDLMNKFNTNLGGTCYIDDYASVKSTKETYSCNINSTQYSSSSSCISGCVKTEDIGTVSPHSNTTYNCPSGWSTYSGSGSSLQCYRAAAKG